MGILDAFWESKGLVSPEKFREFCAPVVLLARFPKRTYLNDETMDNRIAVKQLLRSITDYMDSENFNPAVSIPVYQLDQVFTVTSSEESGSKSNAAVMQLLNQ